MVGSGIDVRADPVTLPFDDWDCDAIVIGPAAVEVDPRLSSMSSERAEADDESWLQSYPDEACC